MAVGYGLAPSANGAQDRDCAGVCFWPILANSLEQPRPLQPPDSHHLQAATGWLELGDHLEANEELEKITPSLRAHPDALWIRHRIYEKAGKWAVCCDVAQTLTVLTPHHGAAWVSLSIAQFRLGRTQEALETLQAKVSEFGYDWRVPYNLACYACQLGQLREAEQYLHKAIVLGDENEVRRSIMEDPDLEPLRSEFRL